jgi:DNA-binding NarL/FixJ family response regulator
VRLLRASARAKLIPIIFLTAKDQQADRVDGFRAGVDAYVTKPFDPNELLVIIKNILERVARTHAEIVRLVGWGANSHDDPGIEGLTEAEERVALEVARGLSNKEIAAELDISIRTVENHVSHILAKKNFSNRVEIARFVLERKLEF